MHVDQPFCHVDRAVVVAVVRAQESVGGGVLKLTKLGEVELAGTVPVPCGRPPRTACAVASCR